MLESGWGMLWLSTKANEATCIRQNWKEVIISSGKPSNQRSNATRYRFFHPSILQNSGYEVSRILWHRAQEGAGELYLSPWRVSVTVKPTLWLLCFLRQRLYIPPWPYIALHLAVCCAWCAWDTTSVHGTLVASPRKPTNMASSTAANAVATVRTAPHPVPWNP